MTLSEVKSIKGEEGDFEVKVTQHPRYIDPDKCIACGLCTEKCPRKVDSEYDAGLGKRKAIYVQYAQAVPLKYAIDATNCIYLTKGKCRVCEKFCQVGAITKQVMNRASPVMTCAGGSCWVPSACRNKAKTTTMRVKQVVMTRIAGVRDNTVRRSMISRVDDSFWGDVASLSSFSPSILVQSAPVNESEDSTGPSAD